MGAFSLARAVRIGRRAAAALLSMPALAGVIFGGGGYVIDAILFPAS